MEPERLMRAVLSNMDAWISDARNIVSIAEKDCCRRSRIAALHHQRNLMQAKRALQRMLGEEVDRFDGGK